MRLSGKLGWALIGPWLLGCSVVGEVITVTPSADATLIEAVPENSMGGAEFVNAGTTQNFTRNHGLFRFDLGAQLPQGSTIRSVALTLEVTRRPVDGFATSRMGLFRMLRAWGEGTLLPRLPESSPGLGAPAEQGDATWTHRFWGTAEKWAEPGGGTGIDLVGDASSSTIIFGIDDSPYTFESTAALVNDVQAWVDAPDKNFGWMLRPLFEGANFTARRFASRETDAPPLLRIDFDPPKIAPVLKVDRSASNRLTITFPAEANRSYRLEGTSNLATPEWIALEQFPATASSETRSTVVAIEGSIRFLRVISP